MINNINKGIIRNRKLWRAPKVTILDISSTQGKRAAAIEGGPWVADRCTNMSNPNYNPNDWSCLNLGPS